jgi:hypothetical protein
MLVMTCRHVNTPGQARQFGGTGVANLFKLSMPWAVPPGPSCGASSQRTAMLLMSYDEILCISTCFTQGFAHTGSRSTTSSAIRAQIISVLHDQTVCGLHHAPRG